MIVPIIEMDSVILQNDRVRISGVNSFVTKEESAITLVEVEPFFGYGYINITGTGSSDWVFDYYYSTTGDHVITLRVTTDGSPVTATKTITVKSSATANLFSSDDDLKLLEPDVMRWLPEDKFSWNHVHFRVQELILNNLYKNRVVNSDNSRIVASQILDVKEVKDWAILMALSIIFSGISNAVDDVFSQKQKFYASKLGEAENLCFNILKVDLNSDSKISTGEILGLRSITMVRR